MSTLITGAAGFLGTRLARALLRDGGARLLAVDSAPPSLTDARVEWRSGTIEDEAFVRSIVEPDVEAIVHLAAVVSGQAEDEFDLGMRVNVDGTRTLLDACCRLRKPPRLVFASSIAVFGGPLPEVVPDDMAVRPASSYGSEKAIGELLINEYSRRGFIDGVACRLPIVAIRPGRPNAAASSFVSSIIREPLAGDGAVCPVPLDTRLWIGSPNAVVDNLLHAARLDSAALGCSRTITLPGLTATPAAMLDSLERLGGASARARVRCEIDSDIARIVCTWPGAFDDRRARRLGFASDDDIDAVVRQYVMERR